MKTVKFAPKLYTKSKPALHFCLQYVVNLYHSLPSLSLALGRPLGRLERIKHSYHGKDGTQLVSTVVFISTSTALTLERLQKCLAYVSSSHPLLRARIVYEGGVPCWKEMENACVQPQVDQTADWKRALEQECMKKIDTGKGPLWRVTYLPNAGTEFKDAAFKHHGALLLSFHPSVVSHPQDVTTKVITKILQALTNEYKIQPAGLIRTVARYTFDQSQALYNRFTDTVSYTTTSMKCITETEQQLGVLADAMPQPFESFIRPNIICQAIAEFTEIKLVKSALKLWSSVTSYRPRNEFIKRIGIVQNIDPEIEGKTSLLTLQFSEHETQILEQACRDNDVTLESMIYSASTLAMTDLIQSNIQPSLWDLVWPTSVLKHGRVQITRSVCDDVNVQTTCDDLVNYSYVIDKPYPFKEARSNHNLWQLAKSYQSSTNSSGSIGVLMSYMTDALTNQLKTISELDLHSGYNAGRTDCILSFTNNGNHTLASDNPTAAKVNAVYSITNEHHVGPILSQGLAVVNNCLCLSTTYYTNVTTKSLTEKYLFKLKQFLFWIYESRK